MIGCTNTPWEIDEAILRRFSKSVYIPLPDKTTREQIIRGYFDGDIGELSEKSNGLSCSDLIHVLREASFAPLRDLVAAKKFRKTEEGLYKPDENGEIEPNDLPSEKVFPRDLTSDDIKNVMEKAAPSVSEETMLKFEFFAKGKK